MSIIFLNKVILFILMFLFFSIPLINSHLLDLFGLKIGLYVNGNYEFTKVIFFNIISSIIILLFGIKIISKKKKIIFSKYIIYIILFLIISTFFSILPYTSLFGGTEKGHGLIMILNIIGIFVILINLKEKEKKKLLNTSIYSAFIISIIGIKELYYPTFSYGELSNRLVSTFGHPNYISLFLLLILPFITDKKFEIKSTFTKEISKYYKYIFIILVIIALLLTKSFIAIFLAFSYLYFIIFNKNKFKYYIYIFLVLLGISLIIKYSPEKLSSLFSRFFIWESTIKIIFSDFQIFLLGGGTETFIYYFDNFKSPYLYIFEKIGFSADRPHNIILLFFYNFGILGLFFISYIYNKIFNNLIKYKTPINISLFLASIFLLFNFASIATYLVIVLIFSLKYKENKPILSKTLFKRRNKVLGIFFITFSIYSIYFSSLFYYSEIESYKKNYEKAINIFPYNANNYYKIGDYKSGKNIEKITSEKYYLTKIYSLNNAIQDCNNLIKNYYSIENYFFCGNFLWEIGKYKTARIFYTNGLNRLPGLWDKNSSYYNNIFIKKFISGNRFFSEKYSNIKEILKRVGKQI